MTFRVLIIVAFLGVVLSAAIFGFFYAWVCSTMWGLDNMEPQNAIKAMQAMNASVRNVVFAPAFFATPFVLALAAVLAYICRIKSVALLFGIAGLVYFCGGMVLTMIVNVPMNVQLSLVDVATLGESAEMVWHTYSVKWQFWNQARTVFSGIAFLIASIGLFQLGKNFPTSAN